MSFNMSVSTVNPLDNDGGASRYLIACGDVKCSHGKCVLVNSQPTCECKLGYIGNTCSDTINEAVSLPLILGVLAFIFGFIVLIFGLAFFRQMQKAKQRRKTAKEALRRNGVLL